LGGRLILVAVFLFGMTIFTDLSWLRLMDRLGALAIGATGGRRPEPWN
jgi:S-DNA-T family DNA segregation ATPase FtsK/SpoIIIE